MNVREFNDRFEICESPCHKGNFKIYDSKTDNEVGIIFDRFSSAEKWLESKGFIKEN